MQFLHLEIYSPTVYTSTEKSLHTKPFKNLLKIFPTTSTSSVKMQFAKLSTLLFTLLASGVMAAPAPEGEAAVTPPYREEAAPGEVTTYPPYPGPTEYPHALAKRGFGCPYNRYQCSEHVSQNPERC